MPEGIRRVSAPDIETHGVVGAGNDRPFKLAAANGAPKVRTDIVDRVNLSVELENGYRFSGGADNSSLSLWKFIDSADLDEMCHASPH